MLLLCIWLLVEFQIAKGTSLTLTGSANYAVPDQTFRFTCTVTDDSSEGVFLTFSKVGQASSCAVIVSTASSNPCTQAGTATDYTCGCVSGQTGVYYMNISRVSVTQDEATWRCLRLPTYSNNVTLPVYYAPSIDKSRFPSTFIAVKGRQLSVNCASYTTPGRPSSTGYMWTRTDGSSTSGSTLQVNNVDTSDARQYTCRASNNFSSSQQGQDSATLQLTVQFAPTVSGQDPSYPVRELSPLNINCSTYTTVGNPPSTSYRWIGPNSFSSSQPILSIRSINRNQSGIYTCRAANSFTPTGGSAESGIGEGNFSVDVQYKASFSGFPDPLYVREHTNLSLDCSSYTQSNPAVTSYTWTGPGGYSSDGPLLSISSINRDKTGNFTCTATNSIGRGTGLTRVNVQYGPGSSVSISPQTKLEKVEGSGPVTVTCSADCFPPCNFTWVMGNNETVSHQLHISNVSRTDGGNYSCEAWNGVGDRARRNFVLDVFYLDVPVLNLTKTEVRENDTVEISCEVVSYPTVQIVIENINNRTELVNKLTNREDYTVQHARCLHSGVYRCTADNQKTGTSLNAFKTLSVLCSPRPDFRIDLIRTVSSELNQSVNLNATFIANPVPSFSWYRVENNGRAPIGNQTVHKITNHNFSTSLQVNLTHTRDYSDYAAVAENDMGNDTIVYTLTTSGPPYPPLNPVITQLGSTFLGFEWISDYNSGSDQTFHLELRTSDSLEWKPAAEVRDPGLRKTVHTNLTDLSPTTTYHLRLYSKNQFGTSDSILLNATTLPGLDRTEQAFDSGLAAGAGIGCAVLVILIVVVVIVVLKKRRQRAEDCSKIALHGRNRDAPEMCENEIYEGAEGRTGVEKPVMEDNVLYAGGPATEPQGATEYAAVMKKGPPPKGEKEHVSDVYATPVKKQGKDKVKEKVKDKKGKQQKRDRKRGDVPGQFSASASSDPDANTYANAAFINDETQVASGNPQPPTGRDADGCLYVGIDFGNQKPGKVIIGDEKSPYADIAFGRVGPPPAPDEEEEKKKDTVSK